MGDALGSFRILHELGRGGMGRVYLAEHVRSGRKAAVKLLHSALAGDPKLLVRFESEARVLNLLKHPNIVEVLEVDTLPNGRPFFAMEYLEGHSLLDLSADTPLSAFAALPILIQVCDALAAAHRVGVVHRDLKPENIFVTPRNGQPLVKLLDFGIAKLRAPELGARKTTAGVVIGTPEYMAPEQCSAGEVDGRTDVYALGIISYLLATGRLPFSGRPLTQLLIAQLTRLPTAPHEVLSSVPLGWSQATMRALQKNPADRYPDAEGLKAAFELALQEVSPPSTKGCLAAS